MRSSRRSGTRQAACGLVLSAMPTISSVAAISKLSGLVDLGLEPRDVVVADVAAILAQMRGDAVGAGLDRDLRRAHRIGMAPAARIADGGDVVDVDAEAQMRSMSAIYWLIGTCLIHRSTHQAFTRSALRHHVLRPQLRDDRVEVLEVDRLRDRCAPR